MRVSRYAALALAAIGLFAVSSGAIALAPIKRKPAPRIAAHGVTAHTLATRGPAGSKLKTIAKTTSQPHPGAVAGPVPTAEPGSGNPVLLAQAGDWSVFRAAKTGGQTCFSATQPKDTTPKLEHRAPVFVYLTRYSPGAPQHDLTIRLGLDTAPPLVTANVDGRDFRLTTGGGLAYPPDLRAQQDLLQAMRHGHTLLLKSEIKGSDTVTDSFSLLGLEESLRAINRACAQSAGPN